MSDRRASGVREVSRTEKRCVLRLIACDERSVVGGERTRVPATETPEGHLLRIREHTSDPITYIVDCNCKPPCQTALASRLLGFVEAEWVRVTF
jgi:hypothetical protein